MSSLITLPAPTAPYGFSKYLKSVVDTIVENVNAFKSQSDASFNDASNDRQAIRGELANFETVANQAIADASADRNAIRLDLSANVAVLNNTIATKEAEAQSAHDALQTTLNASISTEKARVDALEAWRVNNTDEINTEVDKAINSKVSQLSFDTIKADLEQADSQIAQNLASAITARTEKDAEHDELLARVEKFVNTMLSSYTLVDADGNALNSFADVVLVPPPVLLYTMAQGREFYSETTYSIALDNTIWGGTGTTPLEFSFARDGQSMEMKIGADTYTIPYYADGSNDSRILFQLNFTGDPVPWNFSLRPNNSSGWDIDINKMGPESNGVYYVFSSSDLVVA